jgi:hypothetical protein
VSCSFGGIQRSSHSAIGDDNLTSHACIFKSEIKICIISMGYNRYPILTDTYVWDSCCFVLIKICLYSPSVRSDHKSVILVEGQTSTFMNCVGSRTVSPLLHSNNPLHYAHENKPSFCRWIRSCNHVRYVQHYGQTLA